MQKANRGGPRNSPHFNTHRDSRHLISRDFLYTMDYRLCLHMTGRCSCCEARICFTGGSPVYGEGWSA